MPYNFILLPSLLLLFLLNIPENIKAKHAIVEIENAKLKVEIADTLFKRSKGLMFKNDIEDGMLFVFSSEEIPTFYNKNVKYPLTFFWINRNYEIVDVTYLKEDTFKTTRSSVPIKYVLEVKQDYFKNPKQLIGNKAEITIVN